MNSTSQDSPVKPSDKIEYEFNIEGMTCVACSGAIERGMKLAFKDKGLLAEPQ